MTVTGAYRRLLGALVMLIAIGIQLSGGMCIHSVGSRPVATADWQGFEGLSLSDVVDGRSVVSRPSSRDRSRPYRCANGHRQTIIYDGVGRKLRVDYCQVPEAFLMAPEAIHPDGDYEVKMRKEYIGPHIVTDGRLSYTSFDGGYFDPEAGTMYYITDWQGNNAAVVSAGGDIVQQTTYYPYGEPTVEPAGQPFLFGGKEREHGGGRNIHDFGARCLTPYGNWSVTDPLYENFFPISQYSYCGGDPINRVDPDGKAINLGAALVGALVGAAVNSTGEIISQVYKSGRVNNWTKVGGAVVKGAIVGATAGATMGMSLVATTTASAVSNVVGGVADRAISGEGTTATDIVVDGVIGAGVNVVAHYAGAFVRGSLKTPTPKATHKIGETGKIGEKELAKLGGKPHQYRETDFGGRIIDRLVGNDAHEAKVGYTTYNKFVRSQVMKDANLLITGRIETCTWHFYRSPVTGKIGPSAPLRKSLEQNNIKIEIHE